MPIKLLSRQRRLLTGGLTGHYRETAMAVLGTDRSLFTTSIGIVVLNGMDLM